MSLLLLHLPPLAAASGGLAIATHRRSYDPAADRLQPGEAAAFRFARYQSPADMQAAFTQVRAASAFRYHVGNDGRKGHVCSTKLGGDWVLAESVQVAPSCTCEQVLRAYLDGALQKRWNADKVAAVRFTRKAGEEGCYYQQDIELHSVRVIRTRTGPMRYSQQIHVDKVGAHNYCCFVQLDPGLPSTARKPFESLGVYVGLQQEGEDVKIYAAGVFEVNRRVVPNLLVFDASGIAGDMAGKGTLWLSGHFEQRATERAAAAAARAGRQGQAKRVVERFRSRLRFRRTQEETS